MKKLILNYIIFIGLLAASFVINKTDDILSLQKRGEIRLELKGNSSSTHYLEPLTAKIVNNTREVIEMKIPAGLHFKSKDEGIQDIISTQSMFVKVAPNSHKEINLKGVCIQQQNSSPGSDDSFTLSAKAEDNLFAMASFLDDKHIIGSQAQQAMWVLTNGNDLENVIGFTDKNEKALLDKTAMLAGLKKIDLDNYKTIKTKRKQPTYSSSLKGYFKFEFPKGTNVQIAIFNQDNVLIKEVLNKEVAAGFHKVDYQLETTEYEGQKIISQLIAYNKVISRRTIDLRYR